MGRRHPAASERPVPEPASLARRPMHVARIERVILWLAPLLAAVVFGWLSVAGSAPWRVGDPQRDRYSALVEGLLKGQLSLDAEVPPALLALVDPYDPRQRPAGLALHDASLYRGRYYIYFGVVPAIALLLPFRIATGHALPLGAALVVLATVGYTASLHLLVGMRRRLYPTSGPTALMLSAAALATATMVPTLVCRHAEYELAIAGGYALSMLALWLAWLALTHDGRWRWYLAGSSLCWGLAVGSRPTSLLAAWGLVAVLVRRGEPSTDRPTGARQSPRAATLAALCLPMAAVLLLLALYNHLRFGNPFEFGVAYQLSGAYEAKVTHFSLAHVPYNVQALLLARPELGRYFPFYHPAALSVTPPASHFGTDAIGGVLPLFPFLAVILGLVVHRQPGVPAAMRRERLAAGAMLAWTGLAMLGAILLFCGAMARYQADFLPAFILLACLGALALSAARQEARRRRSRTGWTAAVVLALGLGCLSCLNGLLVGFQTYDALRRANLPMYRRLAAASNRPVHALERLTDSPMGCLQMTVELDPEADGGVQVLFRSGDAGHQDAVLSQRGIGGLRLGFRHTGAPDVWSHPLQLRPGATHAVQLWLGSLLMPPTAPPPAGISAAQQAVLLTRLQIDVDGIPVLLGRQHFHETAPETWAVGRAAAPAGVGGLRVVSWRRDAQVAPPQWRLRERVLLVAPPGLDSGFEVPVGTGSPVLQQLRLQQTAIPGSNGPRYGWELALRDAGTWVADAVPAVAHGSTRLELYSQGGLGQEAWLLSQNDAAMPLRPARGDARAQTGGPGLSTVRPVSVQPADDLPVNRGELGLRVCFPDAAGGPEPLLVSGESLRGDFLFVEYLAGHRFRLGWDDWGGAPCFSDPVAYEPGRPYRIEIQAGPLDASYTGRGPTPPLRVLRDGVLLWERAVRCYPSAPEDLTIGFNAIGGTSCGAFFSGSVEILTQP